MNREITNSLVVNESLRPQVISSTAVNGQTVDLQGADACLIAVTVGAITGSTGDSSFKLVHGDESNLSDVADVTSAEIEGTQPATATANTTVQYGYKGAKRYVRLVGDRGTETNIAIAGVIITGKLSQTA